MNERTFLKLTTHVFKSLIQIITGSDIALKAPIFEKIADGATVDGELAYKMITNGRFIRGFNTTHATLSINFDKLFRSFSNIFCLGLSIEQDENGNTKHNP